MKFGKTAQIVLIIGIFAVAIIMLYRVNLQQQYEQAQINIDSDAAQLLLSKLVSEGEDLNSQLTQLESDLAEATSSFSEVKGRFPDSVESIEYDEILFEIAYDYDLDIMLLTASEPAREEVKSVLESADTKTEGDTYSVAYNVTSFEIEVQGKSPDSTFDTEEECRGFIYQTVGDILSYFNAIATGEYFTTATAELVRISVPEPPTEAEIEEAGEGVVVEPASAAISVVIYDYEEGE